MRTTICSKRDAFQVVKESLINWANNYRQECNFVVESPRREFYMKQTSMSDFENSLRKRTTKREEFLRAMDAFIPWAVWISLIEPYYPAGKRGRKPRGIEIMLRMYLLQCWFNLSDEGVEEAIYDSHAFRMFMGINFFDEQVPDATACCSGP